jgi:S1-C subfamily serine protease
MDKRVFTMLATLAALSLVFATGAALGGAAVHALSRGTDLLPVVKAQELDPTRGIVIAAVQTPGPAAEAGVVRGDILQAIDGQTLNHVADLAEYLADRQPGEDVQLKVLHGDELRTLAATLGDRNGQAHLGLVSCQPPLLEELRPLETPSGALITRVLEGSPAATADLRRGDVIVALDGQPVDAEHSLADLVGRRRPDDSVTLQVERPGDGRLEITAVLGEDPDRDGAAYLGVHYVHTPRGRVPWGLQIPFEFDFDLPSLPPYEWPQVELGVRSGVLVMWVEDDSAASAAGIASGDVIHAVGGEPVRTPAELSEAIGENRPGDRITLSICELPCQDLREVEVQLGDHPKEPGKAYLGVRLGASFHIEQQGNGGMRGFHFWAEPGERPHFEWLPDLDELPERFQFPWQRYEEALRKHET